ncbi:MAG: peptide MFS transporter [Pirellulaceae bacterium]
MIDTNASSTEASLRHPPGLYTLFFTEMWERFSYYGMRALLVLFMTDAVAKGGMNLGDKTATAIYGLYTALVYLVALPGGWVADRILGAQRAVWYGGIVIALGHFTLAIPRTDAFFAGLFLIVAGTGLLKPNISVIVGQLYPEGGARRDAGFTIFYMGINVGAGIGPLVCSTLGERLNWHYGFAAAGIGMVLGLVQFYLTGRYLGDAGKQPAHLFGTAPQRRGILLGLTAGVIATLGVIVAVAAMQIRIDPTPLARYTSYLIVGIAALYLGGIFVTGRLSGDEVKRMIVLCILLVAAALFWAGFEQAGSSLNLFAERHTIRSWSGDAADNLPAEAVAAEGGAGEAAPPAAGGFEIPAGWFQSLNPIFIITLSPLMASLWVSLARRHRNPSIPAKFGLGLVLVGLGFLLMAAAAKLVSGGERVWPTWLLTTYFLHTVGELCLSPVGLSAVSKLSPARFAGQMMGMWFVAASLGNLLAGLFAGEFAESVDEMPMGFLRIVATTLGSGLLLLALVPLINRWVGRME